MEFPSASQPFPTVLLRHTLPDHSEHFDWMLGQDAAGKHKLISFRASRRIDELQPGETVPVEHIGDHRSEYLTYEGPVSGLRGEVRRVRSGRIDSWDRQPAQWEILISWQQPDGSFLRQHLTVAWEDEVRWTVRCG